MGNMKMKKLFAVLLALSLASTASNGASELEDQYKDQYYAGLNFGAGWGDNFKMKPSVVFGYHHNKNSKFELEVLTDISNIADKVKRKIGASLLANYRYYPDLGIDPVKLYVSAGLGGYLQIIPFSFGGSGAGGNDADEIVGNDDAEVDAAPPLPLAADVNEVTSGPPLVDKILSSISYKLKVGVDYEITPQIVGTVAIAASGKLSGFKPPIQIPDAIIEVGIRYNF